MEERSCFVQIMVQSSLCTFSSGFNLVGLAIKNNFKKSLKILELAGLGSWSYEVLPADVVWRFPIAVYNMLEII